MLSVVDKGALEERDHPRQKMDFKVQVVFRKGDKSYVVIASNERFEHFLKHSQVSDDDYDFVRTSFS